LYFTRVHADVPGDTSFPEVDWTQWQRIESDKHSADANHEFSFTFETYSR
jgi:dihydrofolate reductase